jgi:hypothetical protein
MLHATSIMVSYSGHFLCTCLFVFFHSWHVSSSWTLVSQIISLLKRKKGVVHLYILTMLFRWARQGQSVGLRCSPWCPWRVVSSWINVFRVKGFRGLLLGTEDGGSTSLWNIGELISEYTPWHHRGWCTSKSNFLDRRGLGISVNGRGTSIVFQLV